MAGLFFSEYVEGSSNNKALEIYNSTDAAIDLAAAGYVVQMYFNGSSSAGLTINLTGTVANGDVFVLAQSNANAAILAQADQTSAASWFNGDDAIVLRRGGATGTIIDVIGQVGVDPGTEWGSGLISTADNTLRRKSSVTTGDTIENNAFDPSIEWDGFATDTLDDLGRYTRSDNPTPTSSLSLSVSPVSFSEAAGADAATGTVTRTGDLTNPLTVNLLSSDTGEATVATTVTIAANQASANFAIAAVDDALIDGSQTVTLTASTTNTNGTTTVTVTDNDATAGNVRIRDIQGASHTSPYSGQSVSNVAGIVTAVRSNGFYLQDPDPDADDATSEGIFVFTGIRPTVSAGDSLLVSGNVSEFTPGGANSNNLSITQIGVGNTGRINTLSTGNPLPAAIVIGSDRTPPTQIIDNDSFALFDPAQDGIDFYESLEGMRVQVNNAVAVSPTNDFGEIAVLANNGANAGTRTERGGIIIQQGDFNPERIIIDDLLVPNAPQVNVSDRFNGSITGVIDYSFGNYKLLNTTALPTVTSGGIERETTTLTGTEDQLTVASFNVENLDPSDGSKFGSLANLIVNNLKSPDILSLEEIQDNNGATNDSVVDANLTYQALIDAIAAAGGPTYEFRQVNPADDQDGGQPGGNIRVGFLFNPERVDFVDRPGGTSTTNTTVIDGNGAELSASPGRIVDTDLSDGDAFANSRKPLVGEFIFNDNQVFVIGNHFNSKGGDQPLFGSNQPPTLTSEAQRLQQAEIVNNFVENILAADANANVAVMGDFNDFQFSDPLEVLKGDDLTNLVETLPLNEQYTYVFEGNSQALDHILVSGNLRTNAAAEIDIVHLNAEFADQQSDHDPLVARFTLPTPVINGTANDDVLTGTNRNETINGGAGNDTIDGGAGNDTINGGAGDDTINGDAGDDTLDGGTGYNDRIFGGDGNDTIIDPDGVNAAHGKAGNNTINVTFAAGWDNDTNPNNGSRSDGKIGGGFGDDNITVTMNNSKFFINLRGDEPVTNQPQDGNDVITLLGTYQSSVVDMNGGNDTFNGGVGGDNVSGGNGIDLLNGGAGGDKLSGGDGNDSLIGGAGNDLLVGGAGNDALTGDAGGDRFVLVAVNNGIDTIVDFMDGEDRIGLSGGLNFGQLNITQGTGANVNDTLISLKSNDDLLAILTGVESSSLNGADFTMV
ncbi:lamin tail domain-containing protein [Trichocoleus sp. FACHB-90]|uniref:lamin tail domain-containing protein n=1 Tax=Cyanophyceae TaxID=3028117 RepID=UPI001685D10A|nr:lamin tail domain-containing protein [Trichocoleus sp. FACHB-90]MBD1929609.1 lamin tail domain-containing protein [Trichocoleus sp. FACHB-90]